MIELSKKELCSVKDNSIHLSGFLNKKGVHKKDNLCQYETIEYGKNILHSIESIDNHRCRMINLSKTKTNYIFILAQKDELVASNKNLYIIPSTLGKKSMYDNFSFHENSSGSGSVIISYILLRKDKSQSTNDWSNSSIRHLKRCKTNICKGNETYFGSGYYASFGNRARTG